MSAPRGPVGDYRRRGMVTRTSARTTPVDGEAEPVLVKLGVWVSNTKARRDKLTAEQRAILAELRLEWA